MEARALPAPARTYRGLDIQGPTLISKAGKQTWNLGSLDQPQPLRMSPISVSPNQGPGPEPPSSPQTLRPCRLPGAAPGWGSPPSLGFQVTLGISPPPRAWRFSQGLPVLLCSEFVADTDGLRLGPMGL